MKDITPEFAEIIGLLCAEGSHIISYSSYWGKDRGKKRFYKNDQEKSQAIVRNIYWKQRKRKIFKSGKTCVKKARQSAGVNPKAIA